MTGSGQQRSIQANDLRAPITSSGQQHQNHVNESSAPIIDSRQQRPSYLNDQHLQNTNFPQITNRETQHRDDDIGKMRAQLQSMNSKVHQATSTAPEIDRVLHETHNTPFTTRLLSIPVRHQKNKIKLPTYNGTSNPREYLTAFSIANGRANFSPEERDAGLCQLFVENLSGLALGWFSRLETHSIENYNKLSTAFLKHYSLFIQQSATNADLWTLAQEPTKTLRSYIDKFRAIVSRITVLDKAAVLALRNGLWHESPFREEIMKYKPQTLEDALHRAITFIEIEEDKAAFSKKHTSTKKSSSKDKEPDEYYEPRHHYDKAYRDGKSRKASNYQISDHHPVAPHESTLATVKDQKMHRYIAVL
ncbi:PREDICTED: uncharacterized protein LOC106330368 [Brassica oleracea var. oleracea]|uniref:uncharacterized protein LOC106330368 n=1 Tax=Brassica oleracea var. oleracea TaxID=109376 RepID=UPI0006A72910|nr:PREDICTED: uncharacterized protein LOC106330368 [Brassica oleracea var. oleracea]